MALQYLYKIKFAQSLGLKEEHWKISSLRPIKYFTKKMFYGKKKKRIFLISFTYKKDQGGFNKKEIQLNPCNIFSIFTFNELYLFV